MHPLSSPGMVDVTADVDFSALARVVQAAGAVPLGPVTQVGRWKARDYVGVLNTTHSIDLHLILFDSMLCYVRESSSCTWA